MPQTARSSSKKQRWAPHMQPHRPAASTSSTIGASSVSPPTRLFAFAASSGLWEAFTPTPLTSTKPLTTRPLRIVTWNTYSSSPGYTDAQARTLLRVMRSSRGDVFALQEVSAAFEALLQREAWVRDFAISQSREFFDEAGDGAGGGGKEGGPEAVLLMVRKELVGRGSALTYERLKVGPGERGKALVLLRLVGATGVEVSRQVLGSGNLADTLIFPVGSPHSHVALYLAATERTHPPRAVPARPLAPRRHPSPLFDPSRRFQHLSTRRTCASFPTPPRRRYPTTIRSFSRRTNFRRTLPLYRRRSKIKAAEAEENRPGVRWWAGQHECVRGGRAGAGPRRFWQADVGPTGRGGAGVAQ